ncbi:MAG: WbqC family protein [Candidatus Accumulibacter sp.]|uniref:WbqC family protein n=1 Tax=Accumulibacter sp. TaxID=2053492 RepID=UPI002878B229|nr:WbqC family protein [Accumulibacter sp.]MDS4016133.1 WbqC family protein [Accumulibacter sp.]
MQPYFLPYIGYYQLIAAVDCFVVYDNIQYTKKGWINRNRILRRDGCTALISLPLKSDSATLEVRQRQLATAFQRDRLLNQIREAYHDAPQFARVYPLLEHVVNCSENNLFAYLFHSLTTVCAYLEIATPLLVSSSLPIDHRLHGQDKVLALCRQLAASRYLNPIGGVGLYSRDCFSANGLELKFLQAHPSTYAQRHNDFVPALSIVDVMMFNPLADVRRQLAQDYELL